MKLRFLLVCVGYLLFAVDAIYAAPPATLAYQGRLETAQGDLVNTPANITFRIYDAATNGVKLWEEAHTGVPVTNGIFTVILGKVSSLAGLAFDKTYYMSLEPNSSGEMAPRIEMTSAPYAMNTVKQSSSSAAETLLKTLTTPKNVAVAPSGSGQASVTWNAIDGATSYNLYLATETGVNASNYTTKANGKVITGVTSPYTVTGLTNGIEYFFALASVTPVGESAVATGSAPNQAPTISSIDDKTTNAGTATSAIAFTVGDVETAAASLTVSGSSSNKTLVPDTNIVFGGSGSSRTVTVTPASGQGSATITLTVSDGTATASTTFTVTVNQQTYTNSLGMEFVLIPAGTFTMGSPSTDTGRGSDETQHSVTISNPFFMQTTEVTQGQWTAVMGSNPSYHSSCGDTCPVERVSWTDTQLFLIAMNTRGECTYRLPTEAEWEYAARAGTTTAYSFGDREVLSGNYAWYQSNSGSKTHPVAQKLPNPWGLYDVHGNVSEWVEDGYGSLTSSAATDPTGATSGSSLVYRGGSWNYSPAGLRSANRINDVPGYRSEYLGLRLARTCP